MLAPPLPGGSSVQVRASVGDLDPGPWTQPGCYPGHINLPSIYSVRPASQGHGLLTPWQLHRGKLIPDTETRSDPQFHDLTIAKLSIVVVGPCVIYLQA